MDYEAINKLLQDKSQAYGQSQAKFATIEPTLRSQMFGNDSVTNNLNQQEQSKIDELYSHDKNVAAQYQTPPAAGMILDPYIRELQVTNRYRNTTHELTDINQNQQKRRDVIGDSLQNALKLAQASLEMKKTELEQLQKDRDFAWEVYKEKNKGGSGGGGSQNVTQSLFNTILGLQDKVQAATPGKTGTSVQKVGQEGAGGKVQTSASIMSQIQKQNPNKQIHYTMNKDGTISYAVVNSGQSYMQPSEADALDSATRNDANSGQPGNIEGMVKKLSLAAIAGGAPNADVSNMLQLMGYVGGGLNKAPSADAGGGSDLNSLLNPGQSSVIGGGSSASGGMTVMIGTDGKQYSVPNAKVAEAKQNGWRVK